MEVSFNKEVCLHKVINNDLNSSQELFRFNINLTMSKRPRVSGEIRKHLEDQ